MGTMNARTLGIIGTGAAVLVIGGGFAAAVASAAPSPGGGAASTSAPDKGGHAKLAKRLAGRMLHGEMVVKGKDGNPVTVDSIRGEVTAVSASSISVKASDGVSMTYVVTSDTKVHEVTPGTSGAKPTVAKGTIADIANGDSVLVAGTKSGDTITARQIVERTS